MQVWLPCFSSSVCMDWWVPGGCRDGGTCSLLAWWTFRDLFHPSTYCCWLLTQKRDNLYMLYSVHTKPHSCAFQAKLLNINAHERASLPLFTFHLFCWANKKDAFQEQVVPVSKSMLNMILFFIWLCAALYFFLPFFPFLLMRLFFCLFFKDEFHFCTYDWRRAIQLSCS